MSSEQPDPRDTDCTEGMSPVQSFVTPAIAVRPGEEVPPRLGRPPGRGPQTEQAPDGGAPRRE